MEKLEEEGKERHEAGEMDEWITELDLRGERGCKHRDKWVGGGHRVEGSL